jgi:hypothetical protein
MDAAEAIVDGNLTRRIKPGNTTLPGRRPQGATSVAKRA